MPFGATALDFAYDIHSKIGNSAISAKINHKLEPITTQINSGDQIEIITADTARPKPEWLDIVTTAKAKSAIKSFLKRERQNNIERGMQLLEEKMKSLNIQLSGRVLRKIVPIYESNNKEELYSKIGAGIVSLDDLDKVLKVNSKSKILKFWTLFIPQKKEEEGDDTGEIAPPAQPKEPADEPQFEIAECCKPIPGDKVVGYRNPVTGKIIVHKATCDELNRLAAQYGKGGDQMVAAQGHVVPRHDRVARHRPPGAAARPGEGGQRRFQHQHPRSEHPQPRRHLRRQRQPVCQGRGESECRNGQTSKDQRNRQH